VIHLHNLHGWFINLPLLFRYIKKHDIPVIWTLHDCWSFTGHCPYYDMVNCDRWRTGCHHCSQFRRYPGTWFDYSATMFRKKRRWFTGVKHMTVVTPSKWLADQVQCSYLGDYSVKVINNGVDLQVFQQDGADIRQRLQIDGKYMILGVAYEWDARKGLDVFTALAQRLGPDYRIVLVGTDERVDAQLPKEIISIHRTQNQRELAQLYSAADVFVNPTREENFPTVNMEALACGTPVVTFATGGSPEIIDEHCGIAVPKNDEQALENAIRRICQERSFTPEACRRRAGEFTQERFTAEYMDLYERITANRIGASEAI
jgi:glycosyltransferase involved in cell wall biosynthesis